MYKRVIVIVLVLVVLAVPMLSTACGAAKEEVVEMSNQTTAAPTTTGTTTTATIEDDRISNEDTLDLLIAFTELAEPLGYLMSVKFDTEKPPLLFLSEKDKIIIMSTHMGFLKRYEEILERALDLFTPYSESDLGFTYAEVATYLVLSHDIQELAEDVLDAPPRYD